MFTDTEAFLVSSYAFQFLVEIERRLAEVITENDEDAAQIISLRERIRTTCQGHVMWLENVWKLTNPSPYTAGRFMANYWVTGETQDHADRDTWKQPCSVTDTAFQILKITEHVSTYKRVTTVQPLLTRVFVAWLQDLHRLDPREKFAWPRPKQDGAVTFRLEDHFWVWKALKAMEDQQMWSQLPKSKRSKANGGKRDTKEDAQRWKAFLERVQWTLPDNIEYEEKKTKKEEIEKFYDELLLITRRLSPRQVQRGVLQRFTTVNDVSGEVRAVHGFCLLPVFNVF